MIQASGLFAPVLRSTVRFLSSTAIVAASIVASAGLPVVALAQDAVDASKMKSEQVLSDFIHYINIDQSRLAQAMGAELISRKISPSDFVKLVEGTEFVGIERFDAATAKAVRVSELEPIAAAMIRDYTKGRLETARLPANIEASIKMLTGTTRGRVIATERLKFASEYAVPQLLIALLNSSDPVLRAEAQGVLIAMGPKAVAPLSAALRSLDPVGQERVADILGTIKYPASLPYLAEVQGATKNAAVKAACERALAGFGSVGQMTPAELYEALAERYYQESVDVTSFEGEDFQLLWDYKPAVGLIMTAIRTPVYHEAMAMKAAERSLTLANDRAEVLALWVAANFKREIETPAGYVNPSYAADRKDAMYFGVATGSQISQRVLARAIDTRNTQLARRAIAALSKTAGGADLWKTGLDRQPLLEALSFPNRRVQYEAALVLAGAQPRDPFSGAERVVPILSGAIREAADRYAVVFAPSDEVYKAVRGIVEKTGYKVLPYGKTLSAIAGPVAEAPAVDLVVTANLGTDAVAQTVSDVRANTKLAATPVMILATQDNIPDMRKRFIGDASVAIRPAAAGEQSLQKAVQELVDATSGGNITPEESNSYSGQALAALRDLAIAGNQVLKVEDAAVSLMASLSDTRLNVRIDLAEVISRIDQSQTQVALADAAFKATSDERIVMLGKLAGSVKRFGGKLEQRHVNRLREFATGKDLAESTAAAAVLGALNLPNSQVLPLITSSK